MNEPMDAPLVFLPLDEAFGATLRDESGHRINAKRQGGVEIVEDATFGACVELTGGTLAISLPAESAPLDLTFALWFEASAAGTLLTFGRSNYQVASRPGTLIYAGELSPHSAAIPASGWQLLVVQRTPMGMLLGEGGRPTGVLWPPGVAPNLTLGGGPPGTRQRLARFRVYSGMLDPAKIAALRQRDVERPQRTERPVPIALSLENEHGVQALDGGTMRLHIDTTIPTALRLGSRGGEPSLADHDLRVSFRPGTLGSVDGVKVSDAGWTSSVARDATGGDTLLIRSTTPRRLPLSVAISGLRAAPGGGERSTRVQLGYERLVREDGDGRSALSGSRAQPLAIPAWRALPLDVWWRTSSPPMYRVDGDQVTLRGDCTMNMDPIDVSAIVLPVMDLPLEAAGPSSFPDRAEVVRLSSTGSAMGPPVRLAIAIAARKVSVVLAPVAAQAGPAPAAPAWSGWSVRLDLTGLKYRCTA